MSLTPPQTRTDRRTTAPTGQKSSIVLPAVVVGLLIIGVAVAYKMKMFESPPPPAPVATTPAPVQKPAVFQPAMPHDETAATPAAPVATAPDTAVAPPPARVSTYVPPVDARQLMSTLTSLDIKGPISADDAKKWKDSLQQLVRQGSSSVETIRQYLAQNQDVSYAGVTGADQLGYSSLRSGLLDALAQIGGPESTAAMLQTMQTSIFPSDIATLAATLQQQAPGQYDGQILSAARAQLSLAAQDQLGNNPNVGPLFQLLASAGANGTDVTADLAQYSSKWPFYAAIEMANLPNGAGVSSLVQMVQNNTGGSQSAAAEALAQLAPQNSSALNVLLTLAQQGQLSDAALAELAPYLGGRQNGLDLPPGGTSSQGIHIANGNEDFASAEYLNTLTPNQITQNISAIDQLLQSLPSGDTQAQAALQQQKANLTARQAK